MNKGKARIYGLQAALKDAQQQIAQLGGSLEATNQALASTRQQLDDAHAALALANQTADLAQATTVELRAQLEALWAQLEALRVEEKGPGSPELDPSVQSILVAEDRRILAEAEKALAVEAPPAPSV